jgi:chitin disaccharide deacetylase
MTLRPYLTLCADDYGLAPGVGAAIRELIHAGCLTATSCMVGSPYWPAEAALLRPLADQADIGLHITLSDHKPMAEMPILAPTGHFPSAGRFFNLAVTRRLNKDEITIEIEHQLYAFIAEMGRLPDFLDGHHHVHQLPTVRKAVLDIWRRRLSEKGSWIRTCCEPIAALTRRGIAVPKAAILGKIGAPLKRSMIAGAVPHNASFLGVYSLGRERNFAPLFKRFLNDVRPRTLFMCHPGMVDDALRAADSLTDQRLQEYRFMASPEFKAVLEAKGLALVRLSQSPV